MILLRILAVLLACNAQDDDDIEAQAQGPPRVNMRQDFETVIEESKPCVYCCCFGVNCVKGCGACCDRENRDCFQCGVKGQLCCSQCDVVSGCCKDEAEAREMKQRHGEDHESRICGMTSCSHVVDCSCPSCCGIACNSQCCPLTCQLGCGKDNPCAVGCCSLWLGHDDYETCSSVKKADKEAEEAAAAAEEEANEKKRLEAIAEYRKKEREDDNNKYAAYGKEVADWRSRQREWTKQYPGYAFTDPFPMSPMEKYLKEQGLGRQQQQQYYGQGHYGQPSYRQPPRQQQSYRHPPRQQYNWRRLQEDLSFEEQMEEFFQEHFEMSVSEVARRLKSLDEEEEVVTLEA